MAAFENVTVVKAVKEPLINYISFLAYRDVRDQGMVLQPCLGLAKNHNAEHGQPSVIAPCVTLPPASMQSCKPLRARPEVHICCVATLAKDLGH